MVLTRSVPGPQPELGGLYDPKLLVDYDPVLFDLNLAKLAQQEILKKDGQLVAPWDMPAALCPGTLVAVEATMIIFNFCNPEDPGTVLTPFTLTLSPALILL
jgi:hypothetical protein